MLTGRGMAVLLLLLGLGVPDAVAAEEPVFLDVRVSRVIDGDTFDVTGDRSPVRVELAEIDCPELDQPFGEEAREAVRELVGDRAVRVRAIARNRFGQLFVYVYLPDGRLLNEVLVSRGLAWWKSSTSKDLVLGERELEARAEGRGLWSSAEPVAPWDWRLQAASRTLDEAERAAPRRGEASPLLHTTTPRRREGCCKICRKGIACGNTCISASKTCRVGPGCACNG